MKFKHVLFSGLLMSTAFVACTNEDFETIGGQDYTKDAISLGENFVISGGLSSAPITKVVYDETLDGEAVAIKGLWENDDEIGGAWYAAMTKPAEGQTPAAGYAFNGGTNFASNHPFTRVEKNGNVETAEFQTNTNAFAGKYVIYHPYDPTVAASADAIPVKATTAQTMDVANPLNHVNEDIFFYTTKEYSKGGSQADDFTMSPVPVLYRLVFYANETTRGLVGKTISMVVVESNDENLYSEGEIKLNGTNTYAGVKPSYAGNAEAKTSVYTLTIEGNEDNADYQISAVGEEGGMKKPFYLSVLPADDAITELTFKVVTTEGEVYKTKVDLSQYETVKEAVTTEGGRAYYDLTLNEVEEGGSEDAIYTEQQFNNAWEKCVEDKAGEIVLGAPLTIDALTLNKTNAAITISGKTLTVKDLTVEDGTLTVADLVATNVEVTDYGVLKTVTTTGKASISGTLTVAGTATLAVESLNNVSVARKGTLELTGEGDSPKVSGEFATELQSEVSLNNIELAGTNKLNGNVETKNNAVTFSGATTLGEDAELTASIATTFAANLTNNGTLTGTAAVTFKGATVNNGTISASGTNSIEKNAKFTNNGEISQDITNNGTMILAKAATGTITNANMLNVTVADVMDADDPETVKTPANLDITNNAKAIVNINLASKENQVTVTSLDNSGTVNINKGKVVESAADAVEGDGTIIIGTDGILDVETPSSNALEGYVIVKKENAIDGTISTNAKVACYYADMEAAGDDAAWVIINSAITVNDTNKDALAAKNLLIQADVTLGETLEMQNGTSVTVDGEISLKRATGVGETVELKSVGSNTGTFEITAGSLLKVYENVTLDTTNFANKNYNDSGTHGNAVEMGGTVTQGA